MQTSGDDWRRCDPRLPPELAPHSEVARTHLVSGYDRKSWLPAVTFDDLVRYLSEDGVRLELR